MSRKISHSLVSGRAGAGTGGQGLKIEWGSTDQLGQLHWKDVHEGSLAPIRMGDRGVLSGKSASGSYGKNLIQYFDITTTGNASDFGNTLQDKYGQASASNGSRIVSGGAGYPAVNTMEYITVSATGNATDFGDLLGPNYNFSAASDGIKGVWHGGDGDDAAVDVLQYVIIATTGNATDFGDLLGTSGGGNFGASDGSRGIVAGRIEEPGSSTYDDINYYTFSTPGNASDFGNLTVERYGAGSVSNDTRGVFAAGRSGGYVNTMDYITIASTGNATDFGDLDRVGKYLTGVNNQTRGCICGGSYSFSDSISHITISSTGNSTDAGNLVEQTDMAGGASGD